MQTSSLPRFNNFYVLSPSKKSPPSSSSLDKSLRVTKKAITSPDDGFDDNDAQGGTHGSSRPANSRRGHLKSRLGCFNCKRRRVKCNEKRPCCEHCRRLDLVCSYPASSPTTSTSITGSVRKNPTILALDELRFYHQFLTRSFPTLPFHGEELWMKCTAMSHEYECLARSILALGASHLTAHGNVDYTTQALNHRVVAMKLINEQLAKPLHRPQDADALFASIVCLTCQSSLMPGAMADYLTMTRGSSLVLMSVIPSLDKSIFDMFTVQGHLSRMAKLVSDEPKDYTIVNKFLESLNKVKPLCYKEHEVLSYKALLNCVHGVYSSSKEAWAAFSMLYRTFAFFSEDDFRDFIRPDNFTAQLLLVHMFLLDYVLGPLCVSTSEPNKFPARKTTIIGWANDLLARLPDDMKPLGEWIESYCGILAQSDGRYLLSP